MCSVALKFLISDYMYVFACILLVMVVVDDCKLMYIVLYIMV